MSHPITRATIDVLTAHRLTKLPSRESNGIHYLDNIAQFIDTHRDQPHVGVFFDDIHRGQCRPTNVHYAIEDDLLVNADTGAMMQRHEKHLFVTNEFFGQFIVDWLMATGADPRDGNGCLPTSHFRNSRQVIDPLTGRITPPVYELKSFREVIRLRAIAAGLK